MIPGGRQLSSVPSPSKLLWGKQAQSGVGWSRATPSTTPTLPLGAVYPLPVPKIARWGWEGGGARRRDAPASPWSC